MSTFSKFFPLPEIIVFGVIGAGIPLILNMIELSSTLGSVLFGLSLPGYVVLIALNDHTPVFMHGPIFFASNALVYALMALVMGAIVRRVVLS